MNNEEKILTMLGDIQKQISTLDQRISSLDQNTNNKFEKIDQRFEKFDQRFDEMDKKFQSLEERITREHEITRLELKAEIQHVYDKVVDTRDNVNNLVQVTAKNWSDITKLKSVL